eukprot:CAMPEP_0119301234 /NCGR_PEP_ID=MMETSP1333-20130426/3040_1 /TAXON_ID=418940 /ORGANISM="Scyphosphaera apsteinii, Strain RCC1455" /LENGTH=116 /DNA_ID=CAMNT_0007303249 /DNA_START=406 /DNA_END=753 /DNA_ORIENTATION=-
MRARMRVWCGVVWCGVLWCGVEYWGVVWCVAGDGGVGGGWKRAVASGVEWCRVVARGGGCSHGVEGGRMGWRVVVMTAGGGRWCRVVADAVRGGVWWRLVVFGGVWRRVAACGGVW